MTYLDQLYKQRNGGFRFTGNLSGSMLTGYSCTIREYVTNRIEIFTGESITDILQQIKQSFGSVPPEIGPVFDWGDSRDAGKAVR